MPPKVYHIKYPIIDTNRQPTKWPHSGLYHKFAACMKCGTTNESHWMAQAPGARGGPLIGQDGGHVASAGIARSGVTVTRLRVRARESCHFSTWSRFQVKRACHFCTVFGVRRTKIRFKLVNSSLFFALFRSTRGCGRGAPRIWSRCRASSARCESYRLY
jgi:hypothetical protein